MATNNDYYRLSFLLNNLKTITNIDFKAIKDFDVESFSYCWIFIDKKTNNYCKIEYRENDSLNDIFIKFKNKYPELFI
ncbi:MAG: hypothetical protein PVF17_01490 [Ignavibacteria bacterium]|jgi:hypothetical protein